MFIKDLSEWSRPWLIAIPLFRPGLYASLRFFTISRYDFHYYFCYCHFRNLGEAGISVISP